MNADERRVHHVDAGDMSQEQAKQVIETLMDKNVPVPNATSDDEGAGDNTYSLPP